MQYSETVERCLHTVLDGGRINFEDAYLLLTEPDYNGLRSAADLITRKFCGDKVDVESLLNAKSGRCPEDCSFCAQSSFYDTGVSKYPLLPTDVILANAKKAKEDGASSFCIVCAYRSPPDADFDRICDAVERIRSEIGMDVNVSLGFMTQQHALRLKRIGVKRYNHNLEASESYFSTICSTHDFKDRVSTAKIVKEAGLELCSGGILGMGESPRQRLELAFSLAELEPEEVPVNLLIKREGTPLETSTGIDPSEALRTIAVWRFILPRAIIKVAGGREIYFKDDGKEALKAGANGIITGGYLTSGGNKAIKDLAIIEQIGLKPG